MATKAEQFPKGPTSLNGHLKPLHIVELLYSCMSAISFYLLFISRSNEVRTVWEVIHPAFIPVFLVTTILLFLVIFSSERVEHKLLFIIIHSVLSHVFFVFIFPAGYFGAQQTVLGRTRLVYDNVISDGIPLMPENILTQAYNWFRGLNFQAASSVILTRMFGIDIFWSHLFFVPIIWGTFVPIAAFLVARTFIENKKVVVLSSLLISVFPMSIITGAYSVPNSLGFVFFFFSMYFVLKYLSTSGFGASFLMVIFSFASLVSHPLTGVMSISFVLLAIAFKNYEKEKAKYPLSAKTSLLLWFLISASLLPFFLMSQRVVSPIYTDFSLSKLSDLSPTEIVGELIFGQYLNFPLEAAVLFGLGPLLGFLGMLYILRPRANGGLDRTRRIAVSFLLMGFLIVLIDYRILRLFMVDVPFGEDRLWVFRDFIATPFVAFVASSIITSLHKRTSKHKNTHMQFPFSTTRLALGSITTITMILLLSGWITASIYYAYPHYGPLQTTSYELEAAKHIETETNETYIVISDQWMIYAGGMIVGIHNPRAFYFSIEDQEGITLFNEMKTNVSIDTMIKAMEYNNATVAYFIIEEPRLGEEEFDRVISQAETSDLEVFSVFGEGKLYVFRHQKQD